jgi:hypothetical protein
MSKKYLWIAGLVAFLALVLNFQPAYAHESVTVGDYTLEIGWMAEPPLANQRNAIVLNVSETNGAEEQPVEDISGLSLSIEYGGQTKPLELQPLGEDTPGQFIAPIVPLIPGEYTVVVAGKLGDTDVNVEVHPEEVQAADMLDFPKDSLEATPASRSEGLGLVGWLAVAGLVSGLAGLVLSLLNLRKNS